MFLMKSKSKKAISKIFIVVIMAAVLIACVWIFSRNNAAPVAEDPSGTSSNNITGLVINELMASNGGILPDNKGNYSDWVEFYNGTGADLSLANFSLSDDEKNPAKYPLPNVTMPAGSYLTVFLSGNPGDSVNEKNIFHANFRLSATNGETLVLYYGETLLDKVTFEYMDKNISLARSGNEWQLSDKPSPGFPNTEEGYLAFKQSRIIENSPLILNEIMTSNKVTKADEYGNFNDYIEITNRGDADIKLDGFGLSDNPDNPMKFKFPDVSLKPGEYLLIYCCGENKQSNDPQILFAPFRISSYRASVGLYDAVGMQLDLVTIEEIPSDSVYARTFENGKPTDTWQNMLKPSPLYPNNDEGYNEYLKKNDLALGDLIISEVLASNADLDLTGNKISYDYIKLHNRGSSAIDLSGYSLTTNPKNPGQWRIPDGETIKPNEYKVFISSDLNNTPITNSNIIQTNFRVSKDGDIVVLRDKNDNLLDKIIVDKAPKGASYGRDSSGALCFFREPSPGGANSQGYPGYAKTPTFSQVPGIYDSAVTVELSSGDNETIYYTLDCSEPSNNSSVYSAPITVDKNTVIRAVSKRDGYLDSYLTTGTYLFTTDGVNHKLPVCALVGDPKDLFDPNTGIYMLGPNVPADEKWPYESANYSQKGEDWERMGSIEVFDDQTNKSVFSQNISYRIGGSFGRGREQKGFNILARSAYGDSRLNYSFFEQLPYTEYKGISLRCGAQDQTLSKIRDELSARVLRGSNVSFLYQEYKPYVLYLNGEYWGVYFMKEKRNRFFVAQHENADPDNLDLIRSSDKEYAGSADDWKKLMEYVKGNDVSRSEVYAEICKQIDIDSFTDYMACEIYVGNSDYWNIQYYKTAGGKWKWVYYDFCWGWHNSDHDTLKIRKESTKPCSDLLNALCKNKEWVDKFCRRMAELMKTVYEPAFVNSCIDELYNTVEPEIEREREKFNSGTILGHPVDSDNISSYQTFQSYIKRTRDFAQKRPEIVKNMFKTEFNLSDDYMKEVFG